MKKTILLMLCVCCALVIVNSCSRSEPVVEAVVEPAPEAVVDEPVAEVSHDVVYACNCGPECECGSVSAEAGTCSCGTELVAAHMVKVEGNDALLCGCDSACSCEIDAEDETKCACGTDVRRVSLEGSGVYYCNCGGECTCNFVSTEAGNCACGMELITS